MSSKMVDTTIYFKSDIVNQGSIVHLYSVMLSSFNMIKNGKQALVFGRDSL